MFNWPFREALGSYRRWLVNLDDERLNEMASPKAWLVAISICLIGLLVASVVPISSDFFQLNFWAGFACLLPVIPAAMLESSDRVKRTLAVEWYGVLRVVTAMLFQFFMWSLVCLTVMPASAVMASFPILLASYHGQAFLVSASSWYGALSTIGALVGAWFLTDNPSHHAILLLGGLMSLGSAFIMGEVASQRVSALRQRDAHKEAVDAQILLEREREAQVACQLVNDIRGNSHDAGNALSGLLLNLDYLVVKTNSDVLDERARKVIREVALDLKVGTQRLKSLIEQARDMKPTQTIDQSIDVVSVIENVKTDISRVHPHVVILINVLSPLPIELHMVGGEVSFIRVITNLVLNAVEGNGKVGADHIEVSIHVVEQQWLEIVVSDNGPGFSDLQLERGAKNIRQLGLQTSKPTGSGLGIYTVSRLIQASLGQIRFDNRGSGGARVTVVLPLYAKVAQDHPVNLPPSSPINTMEQAV